MNLDLSSHPKWLAQRIIYLTRHGSHAYGTNVPESDTDIKGIAIPPKEYFFGFRNRFEQASGSDPDLVVFDLRKFISLAANGNPAVLELLWTAPEDQLLVHPIAKKLIEHRHLFLSQKVRKTFSCYAMNQARRITNPNREASNPVRRALVDTHGYDTKDAMHVVRLLRMVSEILSGKGLIVKRPDAEELLGIRRGAWPVEHLLAWAHDQDIQIQGMKSPLPEEPDYVAIDRLCVELVQMSFTFVVKVPSGRFQSTPWGFTQGWLEESALSHTEA